MNQYTPPSKCPKLADLAKHCDIGACNPYPLIKCFGESMSELNSHEVREHPAVKIVLGQLSFLCGESLGPSMKAMEEYAKWKAQ